MLLVDKDVSCTDLYVSAKKNKSKFLKTSIYLTKEKKKLPEARNLTR